MPSTRVCGCFLLLTSQSQLTTQHRMHPDISQLIRPIYPDLLDAPSVVTAPATLGVSRRIAFWDHEEPESKDSNLNSYCNQGEAARVVALARFLCQQGYGKHAITILSPYVGQLLLLRRLLAAEFSGINALAIGFLFSCSPTSQCLSASSTKSCCKMSMMLTSTMAPHVSFAVDTGRPRLCRPTCVLPPSTIFKARKATSSLCHSFATIATTKWASSKLATASTLCSHAQSTPCTFLATQKCSRPATTHFGQAWSPVCACRIAFRVTCRCSAKSTPTNRSMWSLRKTSAISRPTEVAFDSADSCSHVGIRVVETVTPTIRSMRPSSARSLAAAWWRGAIIRANAFAGSRASLATLAWCTPSSVDMTVRWIAQSARAQSALRRSRSRTPTAVTPLWLPVIRKVTSYAAVHAEARSRVDTSARKNATSAALQASTVIAHRSAGR